MYSIGLQLGQEAGYSLDQLRFGFHVPPFNSVHHLHLHVIGLPFKNWFRAFKYNDFGSVGWWMTMDTLVKRLEESYEEVLQN